MVNSLVVKGFLVSIAASLFLSSCGKTLDAEKIEETILSGLTKQGASNVKSVICPTNVTPKVGGEFECIGVLESGNGFAIAVTQQDDQNTVTWKVPSVRGLLNVSALQTEFEQALDKEVGRAKVDCGLNPYRVVKPGEMFECQLIKRDAKSEKESAKTEKIDLSKTIPTTQLTTEKTKPSDTKSDSKKETEAKPSDSIQVTIQPSGDVNWQRIIKLPETKVASTSPTGTPTQKPTEKPTQSAQAPDPKQPDVPKTSAPAAQSAEDFLNQPGAAEDFD